MNAPQTVQKIPDATVPLDSCMSVALENVEHGVLAVDFHRRVIVFNQAAERLTGYTRDELLGAPYDRLPFSNGDSSPEILGALMDGRLETGWKSERTIVGRDGNMIPVETRLETVLNSEGRVIGAVEIFTDLSQINKLRDEVSRSRTLSALGEMAANVAHEIRNPLGGIGGFAALLERDLDDADPRRNLVKKIIEGVASLDRIVSNLLIYTRTIKPSFRRIELAPFIDEVLAFLEVEIESQELPIRLLREFPPQRLEAEIDPSLMQQVLLNLLQNSVHAMRERGGKLTVGLSLGKYGSEDGAERLRLMVCDEGVGMSEDVQGKIFNPFFTTREDGTGLGLAIAKKMILEQRGSISVSSQLGVGTVINIYLPYCK